jgi:hypothetical protein
MLREFANCGSLMEKLERLLQRLARETANIAPQAPATSAATTRDASLFARKVPEIAALRELLQATPARYVPQVLDELSCFAGRIELAAVGLGYHHARRR